MLIYLFYFLAVLKMTNSIYLTNNDSFVNYSSVPSTDLLDGNNVYPQVAFSCSVADNNKNVYFITKSQENTWYLSKNYNEKCTFSKKYVEILKYDINRDIFDDTLLIGETTNEKPNAVGGAGSDYVNSCGFDNINNIIYYISANYYNCPYGYNADSAIVRINAETFEFIDRTLLTSFENKEKFSDYSYYDYKYINVPTVSEIIPGKGLWLGFGSSNTGMWKLNISGDRITLIDQYQKKYKEVGDKLETGGTGYKQTYIFNEIKKSFKNENTGDIFFIEDTNWRDAHVLKINSSLEMNDNTTELFSLEGINYISSIKINLENNRIYVIAGSLSSELYQFDLNFNKLKVSEACNIDFVKFPTEWGVVTSMEIDYKSGYLYPIISTRYGNNGIVKIDMKDLSLDFASYKLFGHETTNVYNDIAHTYFTSYQNYNISHIDLDIGKIYIVPTVGTDIRNIKLIEIDLYGCSPGTGLSNNLCESCLMGEYSNTIGGICKSCEPGYASSIILSTECEKCDRGKYSYGINTISCQDCSPGYYIEDTGASECKGCVSGKYSLKSSSFSLQNCIDCESGKISLIGSTGCEYCSIGRWAKNNKACVECSLGKYSNRINIISDEECLLCPIGYFNNIRGLVDINDCESCPMGRIGIISGATSNITCQYCSTGKFKENIDSCELCQPGYISIKSREECEICPEGKYTDIHQRECLGCPPGKYGEGDGLVNIQECFDCPKGRYSNTSGNINMELCVGCMTGKYNINTGSATIINCLSCPPGKFNEEEQSDRCVDCSPGFFSVGNSIKCNLCEKGQYSLNEGNTKFTTCVNCPAGTYTDFDGADSEENCISCVAGLWNNNMGSISKSACKFCPSGFYSENEKSITDNDCKICKSGKFSKFQGSSSINNCLDCPAGFFSDGAGPSCTSCSPGMYSSTMGVVECLSCLEGRYSSEEGRIICNTCRQNSETIFDKTECICSKGSYSANDSCITCPDDFTCKKGSTIETLSIRKNYWRDSPTSIKTYKCLNLIACDGGVINNTTNDLCSEGHVGPLCSICVDGWAKDDGICLICSKNINRSLSLTIIIPIVCVMIIMFLIKTANPSNNKKEEVNGVVKIFMNYAQVFSLASSFQINWPSLIKYLFERAKELSSPRVSFYSSDCVIGWGYYDKFIIYLTLPLLYIVAVTIIIALISVCFSLKQSKIIEKLSNEEKLLYKKTKPTCKTFFIAWEKTAIVVGTFLSWPTIIEKTLDIMNCERIGNNYYLIKDMSVECYNETHYLYLIIGYIALGIYGIGIPLMGFRMLYKYRYRLFDMQNRYDGSTPLSFLFLGYRENRWYYEFIIMGKKAGLILLSVFLRNYPRYQIIGASLLVQVSFFLHIFLKPYDTITSYGIICNKLESISLLSLVMTLSTGLFFGTVDSGYQLGVFEDVLIISLILSNGGITLYFLLYFITLTGKTIKTHLREHLQEHFEDDNVPCCLKCCKSRTIESIKDWSFLSQIDNYGIHLNTELERQIFSNYFIEKQTKLSVLNSKIDNIGKRKLSIKLDKIRCEIQVMEKQRCWQTIENNRLYSTLKRIAMVNKSHLDDGELERLNEVFNLYITHGIEYNKKMDDLYMRELEDMIVVEETECNIVDYKETIVECNNIVCNIIEKEEVFEICSNGHIII